MSENICYLNSNPTDVEFEYRLVPSVLLKTTESDFILTLTILIKDFFFQMITTTNVLCDLLQ